jgi:hypothetical protein
VLTPNNVNITVSHSNPVAASTLFTASDQDGDTIAQYDFYDSGSAGGHWLLNGTALPNGQDNFVAASQLSQVTYQGGAGTETIWVRASDGIQYGTWKPINATDTAPVLTPNNVNITVSHSDPVAASMLFTASEQDGDSIVQYDFWGSGTAGGHWLLNGTALPNSQDNFVAAAQLSQVTYQGGAGTETIWMRASDGLQYGAWKFINATDTAPVLTPNNVNITVSHSNPVAASTLFTASDLDGDSIVQYDFWGSGTAGGHWLLNGNALPNSQDNFIAAAQLSQVTYQGGAGTETIWVRASDGIQYGAWKFINATDTVPVLTPTSVNITVSHSQPVAASTLFTASDVDGDSIAQFDFWDSGTAGGHWLLSGQALPIGEDNYVNAALLSQVTYQGGAGTETIWVRASDGIQYGAWTSISASSSFAPAGGTSVTSALETDDTTSLDATFTSAGGVKSVAFKLDYDPELVTVADAEPGADLPDTARISLRTVATEDGAEAYITLTSDEPIPAGTVKLASISVSPRSAGRHLEGLRKLHVQHVNGVSSRETESVRISIADLGPGASENINKDTELVDASYPRDDVAPRIRLKMAQFDGSGDLASAGGVEEGAPSEEDRADLAAVVRIANPHAPPTDLSPSPLSLERSHRWKFERSTDASAANLSQSVRIPPRQCHHTRVCPWLRSNVISILRTPFDAGGQGLGAGTLRTPQPTQSAIEGSERRGARRSPT